MNDSVIEFNGVLSNECVNDKRRKVKNKMSIICLIILLSCTIFTIILGINHDSEFYSVLICTIVLALTSFCNALPLPKFRQRKLEKINPEIKVTIQNGIVTVASSFSKKDKSITKVKKVIDMGEWYYLIFKFGDISNSWVCQKNLITLGTIDEFEALFESKLIRKLK